MSALDGITLEIAPGELFCLLGPSGAGKTTLLRTIAGFEAPDAGRILIGERDVTAVPAHRRNTAMMFQAGALWPHLSVAGNVAFGLEARGLPAAEVGRRVGEALESVRMTGSAARRPSELSGGERQRVALARALAVRPSCLLLDEPLSNLDEPLGLELRGEIRRVCREFSLTTVFVTHDRKEALSISDRLGVIVGGRLLQAGRPRDVYRRPARRAVARFLGDADFIAGEILATGPEGRASVQTAAGRFEGFLGDPLARPAAGAAATVAIRPESWTVAETAPAVNGLLGRIGAASYLGDTARYEFEAAGVRLSILERNPGAADRPCRDRVYAAVEPGDTVILLE